MSGNLIVIAGPSGVGKGTLIKEILSMEENIRLSISATTRPKRDKEKDGVDYFFVEKEDFIKRAERGEFLEWADVFGKLYGTPTERVEEWLKESLDVLLEIDVQGAFMVREKKSDAVLVFIEPPSFDELEKRLTKRGTEDYSSVKKRLETAEWELEQKGEFDYIVVNESVNEAAHELMTIIKNCRSAK